MKEAAQAQKSRPADNVECGCRFPNNGGRGKCRPVFHSADRIVRARAATFLSRCPSNPELRSGGFALRHLKRLVLPGYSQTYSLCENFGTGLKAFSTFSVFGTS